MKKPIKDLHAMAKYRPAGYVEDVLSFATSITADTYEISEEHWNELRAKYLALKPIPESEWPLWVRTLSKWKSEDDAGLGDTVHRCLGKFGEMFKAILKGVGIECGCDARRAEWNQLYQFK